MPKSRHDVRKSLSQNAFSAAVHELQFLCCFVMVCLQACQFTWLDCSLLISPVISGLFSTPNQWVDLVYLSLLLRSLDIFFVQQFLGLTLVYRTFKNNCHELYLNSRHQAHLIFLSCLTHTADLVDQWDDLRAVLITT